MKKYILKAFMLMALGAGMTSCGDTFLETDYYSCESAVENIF